MTERIPTSQEFEACCRDAFGFLIERGFTLDDEGEFERTIRGPVFQVTIHGEGYGTLASVSLAAVKAGPVPLVLLVPREARIKPPRGQLAQVRFFASQLQHHCPDILSGDLDRLYRAAAELARVSRRRGATEPAG